MSRAPVLLLALAACDAGLDGPAPPPPTLTLTASDAIPGQVLHLEASGAPAGASVWFVRGADVGPGPCPRPLGFCVDVTAPLAPTAAVADGAGVATLDITLPAGVPVGAHAAFQAVVGRPVGQVSNALEVPVLDPAVKPDFHLVDVNVNSARHGDLVSPRDYLGAVSGWYFGHAT